MLTNFDIIDIILFTDDPVVLKPGDECNQHVINKGLSFFSNFTCSIVNEITNTFYELDNQSYCDLLRLLIPKQKKKRIKWIKREKTAIPTKFNRELAQNLEISLTELNDIIELFPNIIENESDELIQYQKKHK